MFRQTALFRIAVGILAFCALCTDAPAQQAIQAPMIGVVDFQRIARESVAGKMVRSKVDEQHADFQGEIKRNQAKLEKLQGDLMEQKATLPQSEFNERGKEFQAQAEDLQRLVQLRKRQLDEMYVEGMRKVEQKLAEVLDQIAAERGINLILNATRGQGVVLYADDSIVITEEARQRLDKALPSVTLTPPRSVPNVGRPAAGKSKE